MSGRDLFLSYNTRDRESVQKVRLRLEELGLTTFMDQSDLSPGEKWSERLVAELGSAKKVAVFYGPYGIGEYQNDEVELVRVREKKEECDLLVPVLLPEADDDLPGFLPLYQRVDLRQKLDDEEKLASIVQIVRGTAAEPAEKTLRDAINPFRGLRPFREEDSEFYCGRDREVDELADKVAAGALVPVVGASGSGKSSLVRAGLVPRLRKARGLGDRWMVVLFRPGKDPFASLAKALSPLLERGLSERARLEEEKELRDHLENREIPMARAVERVLEISSSADRLLIVVDQLEELFTLVPEERRKQFVSGLLEIDETAPIHVVVTLRADFYDKAMALDRRFAKALQDHGFNLTAMDEEGLRKAIEEPARKVGLEFDEGLVEQILDDVGDEPGNLPLLEFALDELWQRREGNQLELDAYRKIGAVRGAIAEKAEAEYETLAREEQGVLRRALPGLVHVTAARETDTRRRVALNDFQPPARKLIRKLVDARLLVTGRDPDTEEQTVEVAHEALIRQWPRFQKWLVDDRGFLLWRQRLKSSVEDWRGRPRDASSYLYRGHRLREAEEWLRSRGDLTDDEKDFIEAGIDAEREERRKRQTVLAGLAALVLIAVGLVAGLLFQQQQRRKDRALLRARQLAFQADGAVQRTPQKAVLLAANAMKALVQQASVAQAPEVESALRSALERYGGEPLGPADERPLDVVLGVEERWLATETSDHRVRVLPIRDGGADGDGDVIDTGGRLDVRFGPLGRWMATGGANAKTTVWKLGSGPPERVFETTAQRPDVAYSRTGSLFAEKRGSDVYLWNLEAEPPARLPGLERFEEVEDRFQHGMLPATDPSGQWRVVRAEKKTTLDLEDLATGRSWTLSGHDAEVNRAVFDDPGRQLVTWRSSPARAEPARLWNLDSPRPGGAKEPRWIHLDPSCLVVWSPGGERLYAAGERSALTLGENDLEGGSSRELLCSGWTGTKPPIFAVSPGGSRLLGLGETACVWDLERLPPSPATGVDVGVYDDVAAVSPDGTWLAVAQGSAVHFFRDGRSVGELKEHDGEVQVVAFDASSSWLASQGREKLVVWDLSGLAPAPSRELEPRAASVVRVLAFSHGGRWLFSGDKGQRGRLWNLDDERPEPASTGAGGTPGVTVAAFSSGDRWLAVGFDDGSVFLWDLEKEDPGGTALRLPVGAKPISALAFNPAEDRLFAGDENGLARLWRLDASPVATVVELPRLDDKAIRSAAFRPDGSRLATAGDGGVLVWELRPRELIRTACEVAGRDLTPEEWREALGGEPEGGLPVLCPGP